MPRPPSTKTTKICRTCKQEKSNDQFGTRMRRVNGKVYGPYLNFCCKPCEVLRHRAWVQDHPEWRYSRWLHNLLRRHDLSFEQYDAMMVRQGGLCAICREPPNASKGLCLDHDHETGRVRGLLCSNCNSGMGLLRDDPNRLWAAIRYLGTPDTPYAESAHDPC